MVKDGLGTGWVMSQIVIATILVSTVILTGLQLFLHRLTTKILHFSFIALKQELKEAIDQILSGEITTAEPVTPMQMLVMDIVKSKLQPAPPRIDDLASNTRDASGKFA